MRIKAGIEASVREAELGARRFDDVELRWAQHVWGNRVMAMVEILMGEIERREQLLLLCTK